VRDPLIPPLIAVAFGILFSRLFQFSMFEAAWPVAAFFALAFAGLRRINLLLALVFVGAFFEAWHRPGAPPEIDFATRETMIVEGCVVEPTVFSANREQFTLEIDRGARARVSLSLKDGQTPQSLDYGQHVEIDARLRRPHNYNNPGSFDYAAYLARQNIYWTASMTTGSQARILAGRCGSRFMAAVFALRVAALHRIEKLYGEDNYSTGMMEAVLIGETSKLEKIWTENFRRTGTFHALVISGVHVTVLAGVLLFLLRIVMIPEIPALTATASAAWLYALVSGFSPPVVRAAGGFTLYLAARFLFRRGRVMNLLAAVALVYLLSDPGAMFDASFQLSFLCVAAIGALAAPLLQSTSLPLARGTRAIASVELDPHMEPRTAQFRVEMRLAAEAIALWIRAPSRVVLEALNLGARLTFFAFEMAVISTVVQIGLALPMAEYFHRVSFTGLTANLLIVPLLNGVVPVGFIAIFTGWRWIAAIAAALLRWSAAIADWHARQEPSWRVADPPLWIALGFAASLILMAMVVGRRGWRWPALASVLAFFTLLLWHPTRPDLHPGQLELTAIDVGQGDSLLVVFPDSKIMLVDGGGVLQFGRVRRVNLDMGEDVVSPYLWTRGILRVDVIAVTHGHEDHSGGIAALIENFHPREVWTGAKPLQKVLDAARRRGVPVVEKRAGAPFEFGGATVEVISPPVDYHARRDPGNNDSLGLRIAYGQRSFLLTGDMEKPMEARALADGREMQSDVLKVGHHGSKTSTIQPFLDAVSPSIALISAGYENSFGHPHRDVLARLTGRHAAVLRTDLDGLITVRTDGTRIWMDTMIWEGLSAWFRGERGFNWALASE
jgi:competence protein ComEC